MAKKSIIFSVLVLILTMPGQTQAGDDFRLMVPKFQDAVRTSATTAYYVKDQKGAQQAYSESTIREFMRSFEGRRHNIQYIEIMIDGIQETGNITRLFVSSDGTGGVKLIIKPD
jgi:hypothetical protein